MSEWLWLWLFGAGFIPLIALALWSWRMGQREVGYAVVAVPVGVTLLLWSLSFVASLVR